MSEAVPPHTLEYMAQAFVHLDNLGKTFRVKQQRAGCLGMMRDLVRPGFEQVEAVCGISFDIQEGERVAFIGPNGAGKSTTIKMLTGILYPSSGGARVAGFVPWQQRRELSYRIGCVFGQRSQLWYHLSALDSFELLASIFKIEPVKFRQQLDELCQVFSLGPLLTKRVSQMSLGERMRCEVAASLIHSPSLMLLDEPSIGLDVVARLALREFIRDFSERKGVTVLLTSHDTGDIEGVCGRVILINHGRLVKDTTLASLKRNHLRKKTITVLSGEQAITIHEPGLTVLESGGHQTRFELNPEKISLERAVSLLMNSGQVEDISIADPPLEEIIADLYRQERQ